MAAAKPSHRSSKPPPINEIQTRPQTLNSKKGTVGERVQLQANYFKLSSQPDWCIYQYRVDIAPELERTSDRKALLKTHKSALGGYIFDGTVLYTSNPLPQPLELNSIRPQDKAAINIQIRFVGDLVKGDYHYSQISSMLVRKTLDENLKLQLVGRNYFDAKNKVQLPEFKVELWPGYITSIRQHEQSVLLCAEISHKVMRTQTLLDILKDHYQEDKTNYQKKFKNEVLGCVILTVYNNRTYKVDDVDFETNPSRCFKRKDGSEISYAAYYTEKYQIQIKDMNQPLLVSKSKMRDRRAGKDEIVFLIPELCRITGLTDNMIRQQRLTKALSQYTKLGPSARINKLMEFNRRLQTKPEVIQDFKEWNFNIDKTLVQFQGRLLPRERVQFSNKAVLTDKNWNNALSNDRHFRTGKLDDWLAIVPQKFDNSFRKKEGFLAVVLQAATQVGIRMAMPKIIIIPNDRNETYQNEILKLTSKAKPQLILCVVPNNQALRYSMIKKILCIDRPIPSQIVLAKTLTVQNLRSIGCRIATQLNCKVGGIPWTIRLWDLIPGLMVVGYDVCHDKRAHASFGAMVASVDEHFGNYFSTVSQHNSGEELSNDLSIQLVQAFREFARRNGNKLPSKIIIYRDGVGEGQIPFVYDHEVKAIKNKLASIYKNGRYELAFIIVTKRIHTRFFSNNGNPKSGTIVDDVITDPLKYDFFIISQNVVEGTVTPTAYNVIEDSSRLSPDKIQMMTYKLCHMYFHLSDPIRVPAPCQYAHRLAFFASQTLRQSAHADLKNTLYFM
ncbi:piwi-like protein Siwi [Phymastichus coffea]|uniref:piwi-like protein Siwi n=1 Tax=Phymastichus coffea TaxID=108790 RepID=UPI00273CE1C2|nr:piwi-like protein Siwi [Phymastichus coffea]